MHALLWSFVTMMAASGTSLKGPVWTKVFDGTAYGWVSVVRAMGRDNWIAGGPWGVATATKAGTKVEATHGHGVLGISLESANSAYAFGEGELIWHFDGNKWTEEHTGPLPPRANRRLLAERMLHLSYHNDSEPSSPLVAFGLSLVLVKQHDGTWATPPDADKKELLETGQLGPAISVPAKCDRAGWHWFGKNRGALYCHDRRVFVFSAGTLIAKGRLPNQCYDALHSLVEAQGELYASCRSLTLWKTQGDQWRRIAPPKEEGLKEIPSLSVADGCLFVAGKYAVWRACDQ